MNVDTAVDTFAEIILLSFSFIIFKFSFILGSLDLFNNSSYIFVKQYEFFNIQALSDKLNILLYLSSFF